MVCTHYTLLYIQLERDKGGSSHGKTKPLVLRAPCIAWKYAAGTRRPTSPAKVPFCHILSFLILQRSYLLWRPPPPALHMPMHKASIKHRVPCAVPLELVPCIGGAISAWPPPSSIHMATSALLATEMWHIYMAGSMKAKPSASNPGMGKIAQLRKVISV